ncbi:hypothetical protein LY78DRAFT_369816 [Colletotrichum sublineola]|nr:hypothetical protein LY78DRAFT_369816 [Colletotrichum sublineola]
MPEATRIRVWRDLTSDSLAWGRTGSQLISLKMTKTLARCERLADLSLRSKVYGNNLGHHFKGLDKRIRPSELSVPLSFGQPAGRRAWERVGAMSDPQSLTLSFLPGEAKLEDLLCLSSLGRLTELIIIQRKTIARAPFPLSAEHLLEVTTSMRGLKLLRCDLTSGFLHNAKGLTERIACKHPELKELRFGFDIHQPDEGVSWLRRSSRVNSRCGGSW